MIPAAVLRVYTHPYVWIPLPPINCCYATCSRRPGTLHTYARYFLRATFCHSLPLPDVPFILLPYRYYATVCCVYLTFLLLHARLVCLRSHVVVLAFVADLQRYSSPFTIPIVAIACCWFHLLLPDTAYHRPLLCLAALLHCLPVPHTYSPTYLLRVLFTGRQDRTGGKEG